MMKLAKYKTFWKIFATIGIPVGIFWMIQATILLSDYAGKIIENPQLDPGAQLLIPGYNLPLLTGIISIIILALIHEFSHGITAFVEKIKIKSAGFGFFLLLPMIPVAFVEPDEKTMMKRSRLSRLRVLSAGPFANIVAALIFGVLLTSFFTYGVMGYAVPNKLIETGVSIEEIVGAPLNETNISTGAKILKMNDVKIKDISIFSEFMANTTPEQNIMLYTSSGEHNITLGTHPETGTGYLGVRPKQEMNAFGIGILFLFMYDLFFWLYILNLAIGIINFLPIFGITDGCRIVYELLAYVIKNKKILNFITMAIIIFSSLIVIFNLVGPYLLRYI